MGSAQSPGPAGAAGHGLPSVSPRPPAAAGPGGQAEHAGSPYLMAPSEETSRDRSPQPRLAAVAAGTLSGTGRRKQENFLEKTPVVTRGRAGESWKGLVPLPIPA